MAALEADVALSLVREALDSTARIDLSDGRRLVGTLVCLDKQMNLLMRDTMESRPDNETQAARHIGLVLVPFAHVRTCASLRSARPS